MIRSSEMTDLDKLEAKGGEAMRENIGALL